MSSHALGGGSMDIWEWANPNWPSNTAANAVPPAVASEAEFPRLGCEAGANSVPARTITRSDAIWEALAELRVPASFQATEHVLIENISLEDLRAALPDTRDYPTALQMWIFQETRVLPLEVMLWLECGAAAVSVHDVLQGELLVGCLVGSKWTNRSSCLRVSFLSSFPTSQAIQAKLLSYNLMPGPGEEQEQLEQQVGLEGKGGKGGSHPLDKEVDSEGVGGEAAAVDGASPLQDCGDADSAVPPPAGGAQAKPGRNGCEGEECEQLLFGSELKAVGWWSGAALDADSSAVEYGSDHHAEDGRESDRPDLLLASRLPSLAGSGDDIEIQPWPAWVGEEEEEEEEEEQEQEQGEEEQEEEAQEQEQEEQEQEEGQEEQEGEQHEQEQGQEEEGCDGGVECEEELTIGQMEEALSSRGGGLSANASSHAIAAGPSRMQPPSVTASASASEPAGIGEAASEGPDDPGSADVATLNVDADAFIPTEPVPPSGQLPRSCGQEAIPVTEFAPGKAPSLSPSPSPSVPAVSPKLDPDAAPVAAPPAAATSSLSPHAASFDLDGGSLKEQPPAPVTEPSNGWGTAWEAPHADLHGPGWDTWEEDVALHDNYHAGIPGGHGFLSYGQPVADLPASQQLPETALERFPSTAGDWQPSKADAKLQDAGTRAGFGAPVQVPQDEWQGEECFGAKDPVFHAEDRVLQGKDSVFEPQAGQPGGRAKLPHMQVLARDAAGPLPALPRQLTGLHAERISHGARHAATMQWLNSSSDAADMEHKPTARPAVPVPQPAGPRNAWGFTRVEILPTTEAVVPAYDQRHTSGVRLCASYFSSSIPQLVGDGVRTAVLLYNQDQHTLLGAMHISHAASHNNRSRGSLVLKHSLDGGLAALDARVAVRCGAVSPERWARHNWQRSLAIVTQDCVDNLIRMFQPSCQAGPSPTRISSLPAVDVPEAAGSSCLEAADSPAPGDEWAEVGRDEDFGARLGGVEAELLLAKLELQQQLVRVEKRLVLERLRVLPGRRRPAPAGLPAGDVDPRRRRLELRLRYLGLRSAQLRLEEEGAQLRLEELASSSVPSVARGNGAPPFNDWHIGL